MRISDWSSDVCSSDLDRTAFPDHGFVRRPLQLHGKGGDGDVARLALAQAKAGAKADAQSAAIGAAADSDRHRRARGQGGWLDAALDVHRGDLLGRDRKSTRLNSSH